MASNVVVYDPTTFDEKSKVRGVGRYLQILKENFGKEWIFTNNVKSTINGPKSISINPFFNLLTFPWTVGRVAKKQIAVIHDVIPLKYPQHFPEGIKGKLAIFLNKLALKNYDVIVTDSETSKKDIVQLLGVPENKVKVVYPCLPKIFTELVSKKTTHSPQSTNNYCLYVGDGTWNKNLVNLAKAIKTINVTCIFVGKVFEILKQVQDNNTRLDHPWQKELREFYEETKNDKRFIFIGYVSDNELIQFYQNARCNLLVSRDEGFGFSYLEAASQNCPSVLSDIPVLHEISNNRGATFADPKDPHAIANAIGELYFNRDTRDELGKKAKKRMNFFDSIRFRKQFLEILE